jgi:uncharacterized protein YfaP (DUF2135 family)
LSPLPLGEAGRRPGEGASDDATKNTLTPASTLTPALSQREREKIDTRSCAAQKSERRERINVNNIVLPVVSATSVDRRYHRLAEKPGHVPQRCSKHWLKAGDRKGGGKRRRAS